jgi:predicted membrane protein
MRIRPTTLRHIVIAVFAVVGIGLLPWTVWLSTSLASHHVTHRWDLAWTGFDIGLALLFLATAIAAYRRSVWVAALASALGTMLIVDAWFDIVLESHADELRQSIMLAIFAELPAAAFCFWIAHRTERFLAMVIEAVDEDRLHLAATGESPTQSDLVGVLEVTSDGEAAGEPGDAHASA